MEINGGMKVIGFIEAGGYKIPMVRNRESEIYLTEHPDLVECPQCGKKVYIEYREIGYDKKWDVPIKESVYSPLVVEKDAKLQCRGCKLEWIPA